MLRKISKNVTKQYGIIGNPLCHSLSPKFFNERFAQKNIASEYLKFEISSIEEFPNIIKENPMLVGLNVTIPYKQAVIPYLDELDEHAKAMGAVNVVKVETREDGSKFLKGYNTDWYGFTASIKPILKENHKKALILGTGGASKAIAYSLDLLGISYKFVSRKASEGNFTYGDLTDEIIKEHTVLINTSPVGTFPNVKECPNIPYHCITREHVVYDLIYNPIETLYLRQAETCGATIQNGWPMFVNQALKSYEIWEGVMWKE
jgi:shikimate dehydrogenase